MNLKIHIQDADKLENLIEKHRSLLGDLERNLTQIYAVRLELEAKINQPRENKQRHGPDCGRDAEGTFHCLCWKEDST